MKKEKKKRERGSFKILLVTRTKNTYVMKVGSFMFTSKKRDIYYTFSGATRASIYYNMNK